MKTDTHLIGGYMDPRASLDRCVNTRPHRDSIPGAIQPVASRYTDYSIPAPLSTLKNKILFSKNIRKDFIFKLYILERSISFMHPKMTLYKRSADIRSYLVTVVP